MKSSFKRVSVEGYKLFRVNKKKQLSSVVISKGPFKIYYKIGEKNYAPKVLAGKGKYITFFSTLNSCRYWRSDMLASRDIPEGTKLQVWKIRANYILKCLPRKLNIEWLIEGNIINMPVYTTWPHNTEMARNIELLEKIDLREYPIEA